MESKIIKLLKDKETKKSFKEIKTYLNISNDMESELKKLLIKLELEGKIYCDENDYYCKFPSNFYIKQVQVDKKGNHYIIMNHNNVHLNPQSEIGILDYDTVIFKKDHGTYIPIKILKRYFKDIVCEVVEINNEKKLKVSNHHNDIFIRIDHKTMKKLTIGEKVLTTITNIKSPNRQNEFEGRFIARIGHVNDFDTELKSIVYNNGFLTEYPPELLKELENIPSSVTEEEKKGRIDKTNSLIYTIDDENAKDLDDAIEVSKLPNGNYLLDVHIAHVSHYIKPGMASWKFAETNTTSVYLIDKVLSMLHTSISNGICSLSPNEKRLARTFEMEIDNFGEIINFRIYKSVIKSKKKMTYQDVNQIIEKGTTPEGYEDFKDNILLANKLSNIMTARRDVTGAISINNPVPKFSVKDDGHIKESIEIQGTAEKIIENFMVYTNVAVGKYFSNALLPFIYRNHELPKDDRIKQIYEFLKTLNYKINNINMNNYQDLIKRLIKSLETKEEFPVLLIFILQMLPRAYYSPKNQGHFALATDYYSQSTAPIRRFLDLVIHTLIDYYENITDDFEKYDELNEYLEKICTNASIAERCADQAEYEANKLYMLKYMTDKVGNEFDAFISDVNPAYITIKTTDLIDGYVSTNILGKDFVYFPESKTFYNKKEKIKLQIGKKIKVQLNEVDFNKRILLFTITELNLDKQLTRTRTKKAFLE